MKYLFNSSQKFVDSQKRIFHLMTVVLIFSSAFYFFSFITADPDLWGHIKFGEDIWRLKSIPRYDLYSFTAYGEEWINHEWLSELLMYAVYNTFGSPGLLIGKLLIGLAIIRILMHICSHRKTNPLILGIVFVISAFVMSPGFMTRPQVFTFLFTSIFLFIFHLYLERRKNLMWILPLIMILWVNIHGGFLIGAGLFPVIVIGEILSCFIKKSDRNHLGSLILWMIFTEIAICINPNGYRLLTFLYESLSVSRNISEWDPVNITGFIYLRLKLFSLLVIFSFFIDKKRNRYWEISIILIAMIYGFLHQRHTVIFAIIATPFLIEKLSFLEKRVAVSKRVDSFVGYFVMNIAIIILIGFQIIHTMGIYIESRFNIIVDPNVYPVSAVNFLKENQIKGNILVPFEWGEYVIWKLYPDCRVSIDGRFRTVYSQKIIDAHFDAVRGEVKWMELLEKYPADIVLARRNLLSERLIHTKQDWIYVYSDNLSIIFINDEEKNEEVIVRFRKRGFIYPETTLSIYFP